MTPDKWKQIKGIFQEALSQPAAQRMELIKRRCHGDRELESEVSKLLAADEYAGSFLEVPAVGMLGGCAHTGALHSLAVSGVIAGRFQILRFLSSGGMGEVYEAWDSELRERVALKTIRPEIASDDRVIERFKGEVKRARGISHPNVCRVYDLYSHVLKDGRRLWFLAMELLSGKTLLEQVRQSGPFSTKETIDLVTQMAAGLSAAHRLGIVHRDFKSSNVMLVNVGTSRPRVVVTDFGLSLSVACTGEGPWQVGGQGTPEYMAPEQRIDGKVSFAADQYALGVVICEMLTGMRPRTTPGNVDGIELPDGRKIPARWKMVVLRCLKRLPENRFKSVDAVIWALSPKIWRVTRRRSIWMAAVVLGAITAALLVSGSREKQLDRLTEITPGTDLSGAPSLSGDGRVLAYMSDRAEAGNLDIWVQNLPAGNPRRLTTNLADDIDPSIAPDGGSIVFRSEREGGGIYIVDARGGPERLLVRRGRNPRFSPDGQRIAYWIGDRDETVASGEIYVLSVNPIGVPIRMASDFGDGRFPVWSPEGKSILFTGCRSGDGPVPLCFDWWLASVDGQTIHETKAYSLLRSNGISPIGSISGFYGNRVLFTGRRGSAASLWELEFTDDWRRAKGGPRQLIPGDAREFVSSASLASDGTLAVSQLAGALHIWRISYDNRSGGGVATKLTSDVARDRWPSISHDGRWLAFSRGFGDHNDLWIMDIGSGSESLLLSSVDDKVSPQIDDLGETVAFESRQDGTQGIVTLGTRDKKARRLCSQCGNPTGWFNGNEAIFYRDGVPSKIKIAYLATGQSKTVVDGGQASLGEANWSPKSEYLIFSAWVQGDGKRIYAVRFPRNQGSAIGEWIPLTGSSDWSDRPRWSGDGETVFYMSKRDGFDCVWGQHFDPLKGKPRGDPFSVMHYHNPRISPGIVARESFNLSSANDSVYLNVGEASVSVWTARLGRRMPWQMLEWHGWHR